MASHSRSLVVPTLVSCRGVVSKVGMNVREDGSRDWGKSPDIDQIRRVRVV